MINHVFCSKVLSKQITVKQKLKAMFQGSTFGESEEDPTGRIADRWSMFFFTSTQLEPKHYTNILIWLEWWFYNVLICFTCFCFCFLIYIFCWWFGHLTTMILFKWQTKPPTRHMNDFWCHCSRIVSTLCPMVFFHFFQWAWGCEMICWYTVGDFKHVDSILMILGLNISDKKLVYIDHPFKGMIANLTNIVQLASNHQLRGYTPWYLTAHTAPDWCRTSILKAAVQWFQQNKDRAQKSTSR